jgi:hypothetical protein
MKPPEFDVQGEHVVLNPANMDFDERNLTNYLVHEGGHYNYFGSMFAYAEYEQAQAEHHYDCSYSAAFRMYKDEGGTEKKAEAQAKIDPKVVAAKEAVIEKKMRTALLKHHLRAWDKSHENAQSLGHMLRKEMDTLLFNGISESKNSGASTFRNRQAADPEAMSHIEELVRQSREKETTFDEESPTED